MRDPSGHIVDVFYYKTIYKMVPLTVLVLSIPNAWTQEEI
jgi:hypothetical protein